MPKPFIAAAVPQIAFGAGCLATIGDAATALAANGTADRIAALLADSGISASVFPEIDGEPTATHLEAAGLAARAFDAGLVIGLGGGSALDTAKVAACLAVGEPDPMHYALAANPLPATALPKILVPTTAGTGSETSSTSVFSDNTGRKVWIWGQKTKADLALLDPELTVTLPPALAAACGLDAFVHAFEAATNCKAHPGATIYSLRALQLIARSLEQAVREPHDLDARGDLLLGSCYAGIAIDNCGTAIAHMISHAMASLAPVNHGFATALAFAATLPWLIEARTLEMDAAARACGLDDATEMPGYIAGLFERTGLARTLPERFATMNPHTLATAMRADEQAPMRLATIRPITDADIDRFAVMILATAARPAA